MKIQARIFYILLSISIWSVNAYAQSSSKTISCEQAIREENYTQALKSAEQQLKSTGFDLDVLLCKGRALDKSSRYQEAMAIFKKAVKQAEMPVKQAFALTLLANSEKRDRQFAASLSHYRKSLAIAQTQLDKRLERANYQQIAEVLLATNQPELALESYLYANKLSANDNERAESYAQIAALESRLNQHNQAIEFQIKAVLAEERSGDFNQYVNANLEMARIYTVAAQYSDAENSLTKIMLVIKEQRALYWEAKAYFYQAQLKLASGHADESAVILSQALRLSEEIGAQALSEEINKTKK